MTETGAKKGRLIMPHMAKWAINFNCILTIHNANRNMFSLCDRRALFIAALKCARVRENEKGEKVH